MTLRRGDIVMTRFPHAGGNRGKRRPAVLIQADVYNATIKHFLVAEITKNLAAGSDPESKGRGSENDSRPLCSTLAERSFHDPDY